MSWFFGSSTLASLGTLSSAGITFVDVNSTTGANNTSSLWYRALIRVNAVGAFINLSAHTWPVACTNFRMDIVLMNQSAVTKKHVEPNNYLLRAVEEVDLVPSLHVAPEESVDEDLGHLSPSPIRRDKEPSSGLFKSKRPL
jgi:hypothetical protein